MQTATIQSPPASLSSTSYRPRDLTMAKALTPSMVTGSASHGECFCAKFSDDTGMIAAGYADSTVMVRLFCAPAHPPALSPP